MINGITPPPDSKVITFLGRDYVNIDSSHFFRCNIGVNRYFTDASPFYIYTSLNLYSLGCVLNWYDCDLTLLGRAWKSNHIGLAITDDATRASIEELEAKVLSLYENNPKALSLLQVELVTFLE